MPPKAKCREEDFVYNEDGSQVQCKACDTGLWITAKSAGRHLTGAEHLKTLQLAKEAAIVCKRLEKEQRADSATTALQNIRFMAQASPVSIGDPSLARRTASAAEIEMWDGFVENGAEFSAGDISDNAHISHERLCQEADSFGLLNPEVVARSLGFREGDLEREIIADDDEEDFLAEVMRHAVERPVKRVDGRKLVGQGHMTPRFRLTPIVASSLLHLFLKNLLGFLGLEEPEPEDIQGEEHTGGDSEWFPYPSRLEACCKNVPSFDRLHQVQKEICAECGTPSIPCKSVQGNVFFMNDPKTIIARDWSNPKTRKQICVYPEIPDNSVISEIWHTQKWRKNMDLDILSPMYDAGATHYYVNEVAHLNNGKFVIPIRWVMFGTNETQMAAGFCISSVMFQGKVHTDVYSISFDAQQKATIIDDKTDLICTSDLKDNYLDLQHTNEIPQWSQVSIKSGHPNRMPNPKRKIAGGHPMYSSLIDYFGDDVSGNRTKSWNKHWNAYLTHRNLPQSLLQQEFHMHFISTSPNASISEQFVEFKVAVDGCREIHTNPIRVQDETGATTCICIYANAGPSDNPMQSEISAHIGGKGNYFCQKCRVGGTQKEKATNDGYHVLFEASVPRTKENFLEELQKQVKLACTGVAKHIKDSQTDTWIKDVYTQYWIDDLISRFKELKKDDPNRPDNEIQQELIQWTVDNHQKIYSPFLTMKGFDPTKDTPVEILHTILLGIIKYIWHVSHTPWSTEKKQTYSRCLQSTETDGLSIHAIRANYIMQYAGSLIGHQFKNYCANKCLPCSWTCYKYPIYGLESCWRARCAALVSRDS
ncbi:hypothetical protein C8J57DRAFT_1257855 [Mycena rebaudengoi]|nr:hypothetical protein C8J57DRAFT_1257855 [Mycena rebaudengoi]